MAVCEYKKGNHLSSLEYLKSEKITGEYVSSYLLVIIVHQTNRLIDF